jgi:hypothetical protein
MIEPAPECAKCKHFDKYPTDGFVCKAFPKGIPAEIIEGRVKHREPSPGDRGIRFEPLTR